MIAPLRKVHARAFQTLGIVLPLLVVSGVASRQSLPEAPTERFQFSNLAPLAEQSLEVNGSRVKLGVYASREGIAFHVDSGNALNAPDVLVYACPAEARERVSDEASVLGEFQQGAPTYWSVWPFGRPVYGANVRRCEPAFRIGWVDVTARH